MSSHDKDLELSPAVRRLVAEFGLQASEVQATGRDGRLTKGDVLRHLKALGRSEATLRHAAVPAPPAIGELSATFSRASTPSSSFPDFMAMSLIAFIAIRPETGASSNISDIFACISTIR